MGREEKLGKARFLSKLVGKSKEGFPAETARSAEVTKVVVVRVPT
jgi:hypothetical protein